MIASSPTLRRFGALLLLVAFLVAAAVAIAPIADYSEQLDAERARLTEWLQRYQAVRATSAAVDSRLAELEQIRESQQSAYLSGDTSALAAVSLQERAKQVVANAGGELVSTQILPEENAGDLTKIGIQLELKARIGAVRSILYELETGGPRLFVDSIDINRQVIYATEDGEEDSSALTIRLQLSGYRAHVDGALAGARAEAGGR